MTTFTARPFEGRPMPPATPNLRHQFASDNASGVCPEVWLALQEADTAPPFALPYGDDATTAQAIRLIQSTFEADCRVFFVSTGTSANSLALATLCKPYQSILCHSDAHVSCD